MALDFPASPTVGLKYPEPPVAGVPVYSWDGEKWTTYGGLINPQGPADALPLMDATPAELGTSMEFAREDHVHPTDTTRAAVEAASAGMAYSGMQINGGMEVNQERSLEVPFSVTGAMGAAFILDGWRLHTGGVQVVTGMQTTGIIPGFPRYLKMGVTTANAAPSGSDHCFFSHHIEGYRVARLAWGTANSSPITLGFWVVASRAGTFSGVVKNTLANRTYAFTFTINAAGIHEYKTVTIPGDTSALSTDNLGALRIGFTMAMGTTYATAPGAWVAGDFWGATGTVNCVASTADYFYLTGVTVLPGTQAPTAEQSPNIMRPYDQELVTCQRYFRKVIPDSMGIGATGVGVRFDIQHVGMRVAPTATALRTLVIYNPTVGNLEQTTAHIAITNNYADYGMYEGGNITITHGTSYLMAAADRGPFAKLDARL